MKYIKEYKDYRDNNTLNFILNENVVGTESSEEGVSDLESQLYNLLKGKPENVQYKLTIITSESKVPNKDIETGKRMAPLELANKKSFRC